MSPDKQKKMLELVWNISMDIVFAEKMCVQLKSFVFSLGTLATLTSIITIKVAKLNLSASVDMTKKS